MAVRKFTIGNKTVYFNPDNFSFYSDESLQTPASIEDARKVYDYMMSHTDKGSPRTFQTTGSKNYEYRMLDDGSVEVYEKNLWTDKPTNLIRTIKPGEDFGQYLAQYEQMRNGADYKNAMHWYKLNSSWRTPPAASSVQGGGSAGGSQGASGASGASGTAGSAGSAGGTQGAAGSQNTTVDPRIAYNRGKRFTTVDAVTAAQQKLIDAGYSVGRKGADGYWGAESEAAWNKYNTDLGYNQLTNGELMKLTQDQLAGKAVTDNTRTRYNALHAAQAENEAIRARNAEAEKNALTYNGKTYDNFVLYNSAIFDARKAAEQQNKIIRDNNLKGTIQSAADLAGFNADSRRGRNHLNTANAAYTAKTAAEQNGGTWDEAGYVAGLNRRDRNSYLRMRRADSDGNIFNNYQVQAEVAMPEYYSKPELEQEKTIDMNSIRFNRKGGCMYKNGKRVK